MSELMAIMPYSDYEGACNAIREATGKTEKIKSGDFEAETRAAIAAGGEPSSPPWIDTREITDFSYFCANGMRRELLPFIDTSNGTTFEAMFKFTKNSTAFADGTIIPWFNTSNGTNFRSMFYNCYLLNTPEFDLSNGTDFGYMFYECRLKSVPEFNLSKGINFNYMFFNCSFATLPQLDVHSGVRFDSMFYDCKSLTSVPPLDTRNGTRLDGMLQDCTALVTVSGLDLRSATMISSLVNNCYALENLTVINIPLSFSVNTSSKLTMDSLLCLLNETRYYTDGKARTLTMGTTNLAKFTGDYEYVKKVGTILDVDDNELTELTEGCKIPVTWCASTDEGALLVADYMQEKGWSIA